MIYVINFSFQLKNITFILAASEGNWTPLKVFGTCLNIENPNATPSTTFVMKKLSIKKRPPFRNGWWNLKNIYYQYRNLRNSSQGGKLCQNTRILIRILIKPYLESLLYPLGITIEQADNNIDAGILLQML